jgi:nucleotide-binding universal stress UspA family protein
MFRTIVVGSDGRERGRGAVSLAHVLAAASDARLLLVGVQSLLPAPLPHRFAEEHEDLERALRSLRDELAPEAIVRVKARLSPAHALRDVAESESADLVVVGSRHRRRLQHILDGDHALQVLHGAPCAVAVAPDPIAPRGQLEQIGVGLDATPESDRALAIARELAQRTGASLRLYVVVDEAVPVWAGFAPVGAPPEALRELTDRRTAAAQELLAERLEACRDVPAEGIVLVGSPVGELVLASESLDLLVLGSRRWGPVRRLALGSTSERVIRHAACSVLVPARRAETEHAGSVESGAREVVF